MKLLIKKEIPVEVKMRTASPILKIAVIALILFSMAALIALRWVHGGIREQIEKLQDEAVEIQYDNEDLEKKAEQVDSIQGVQQIARDELGLVDPKTVVIEPKS